MDITSVVGLVLSFILFILAILAQGRLISFWNPASIFIVIGGTICSTMVSYPLDKLRYSWRVIKKAFIIETFEIDKTIEVLSNLSLIAKKNGLLALEKHTKDIDNVFLKKSILLVVDGTDPKMIEKMLNLDLENMVKRHIESEGILRTMGKFAPAMGMIGTLIGLIIMLKNLNEPSTLGPAMSVALVTTFYGSFLANVLFLPLAGKLRYKSDKEVVFKMMIIEGILAVQAGESPLMIKEKLKTFVESGARDMVKVNQNEI